MDINNEYMQDFLSRFTYNTNAIEGSTITLPETVSIIVHGFIHSGSNIREVYEVENHKYAYELMINSISEPLSVDSIRDLHGVLMNRLHHETGLFKLNDNAIMGADFETTKKEYVLQVMKLWVCDLNSEISNCNINEELINIIVKYHIEFKRIHPFADGNGRIGRLIINKLLLQNNLKPIVILNENKFEYYKMLAEENIDDLSSLIIALIEDENKREKLFIDNKSNI